MISLPISTPSFPPLSLPHHVSLFFTFLSQFVYTFLSILPPKIQDPPNAFDPLTRPEALQNLTHIETHFLSFNPSWPFSQLTQLRLHPLELACLPLSHSSHPPHPPPHPLHHHHLLLLHLHHHQ